MESTHPRYKLLRRVLGALLAGELLIRNVLVLDMGVAGLELGLGILMAHGASRQILCARGRAWCIDITSMTE
jgi:hypothetical protein